jgi:hypothetical protein
LVFDDAPTVGAYKYRKPTNSGWSSANGTSWRLPVGVPLASAQPLSGEQAGPFLQVVTASQQQPAMLSFGVKGFVAGTCSEFRKFPAFASAAIAMPDLLTQVV